MMCLWFEMQMSEHRTHSQKLSDRTTLSRSAHVLDGGSTAKKHSVFVSHLDMRAAYESECPVGSWATCLSELCPPAVFDASLGLKESTAFGACLHPHAPKPTDALALSLTELLSTEGPPMSMFQGRHTGPLLRKQWGQWARTPHTSPSSHAGSMDLLDLFTHHRLKDKL